MAQEDIMAAAAQWLQEGRRVALATVISTWGSAPCPSGSMLAADENSRFAGSVSGGCVESAVIDAAREVMDSGRPRMLEFGVTDEKAWEVGLACGGRIKVYVEPMEPG